MKKTVLLNLTFLALFSICTIQVTIAQDNLEDVVYLKNGNVYRGLIVEQIPGESLKVKTIGGNIFTVAISDLQKITKEEKLLPPPPPQRGPLTDAETKELKHYHQEFTHNDSTYKRKAHRKNKGYFFQTQFLAEFVQGGFRIVNGYKFNRFAHLGVGLGVDFVRNSPTEIFRNVPDGFQGQYLPLYLYLGGDILNKRITPFYAVEGGVALAFNGNNRRDSGFPFGNLGDVNNVSGALIGGAGLGVKFYTRRKVNLSLLLNVNFKNTQYTNTFDSFDPNGNPIVVETSYRNTFIFPGLRFGLGF